MTKNQRKAIRIARDILKYQEADVGSVDDQSAELLEKLLDYKTQAEKLASLLLKMLVPGEKP